MKCYVWWSIYVRTKSVQKLKEKHLPIIDERISPTEFPWEITSDEDSPGLLRIINYQNINSDTSEEVILTVLRRAYRLANGWRISGLSDLSSDQVTHVMGIWKCRKPAHSAPALESMVFEIEPGQIGGMTNDGGWFQREC